MGFYINPKDMSKEAWLAKHGRRIGSSDVKAIFRDAAELPVCLVDNFAFTAAAIGYSEQEAEYFMNDGSGRSMRWYAVPKDKLIEVCPELKLQLDWCRAEGEFDL